MKSTPTARARNRSQKALPTRTARRTDPVPKKVSPTDWPLSPEQRTYAATLLNQQLWCWGRDIEQASGNVLLRFGLTRRRPPQGVSGSTRYEWSGEGLNVVLWGFGVLAGREESGSLFLPRYEFSPKWRATCEVPVDVWQRQALRGYSRPRSQKSWRSAHQLLESLFDWIARYEQWFQSTYGVEQRRVSLIRWDKPLAASAGELPSAWETLKNGIPRCMTST